MVNTVGGIVHGRPPLSGEGGNAVGQDSSGMKEAIRRRAAAEDDAK
ncbi:MAG: hypothetical protein ACLTYW_03265 [Collinsella sp.]